MIIHAEVDEFSRTIVYVKCYDNNRASTSLEVFRDGVSVFGVPKCVRTDYGGENIDIWHFMIAAHDDDVSSVVIMRVERLWRDVHRCVVATFSDVFRQLEGNFYLDPLICIVSI